MSDIVERLRRYATDRDYFLTFDDAAKAADEIERLKVALREIWSIAPNIAIAQEIARVTLEGK